MACPSKLGQVGQMKEVEVGEREEPLSRLLALVRKGIVRRGSGTIPREILEKDPAGRPAGVLAALLEERGSRNR